MDIIYIKDLRIETIIGIYAWERQTPQILIVDMEMGTDIKPAAQTDKLSDSLDYKAITKRTVLFIEKNEFYLLETLAERLANTLCCEFNIPWLKLSLNKRGAVRGARDVGITIERGNKF